MLVLRTHISDGWTPGAIAIGNSLRKMMVFGYVDFFPLESVTSTIE